MSTGARIPLAEARQLATDFARLFEGCWQKWVIAGSIRRQKPDIGDVEHVCIPKMAAFQLGDPDPNLLWQRCDELLAAGKIEKALYGDTKTTRWGERYRGMVWRGIKHEIFTADPSNFGCILTIRTGPAEYSQSLVTHIKQRGIYRQKDGYLRIAAGDNAGQIVPCPTEESYFEAAGWKYKSPEDRH